VVDLLSNYFTNKDNIMNKTEFVIDNSYDDPVEFEIIVEHTNNGCTIIYDAFSDYVIGEWRDPEVAQRVWDNPQAFI